MNVLTKRAVWTALVLATACGGDPEAPDETSVTQQPLTNVDPCATGDTANATSYLGSSEGYKRWRSQMLGCPAAAHDTTIVDFLAVSNTRYRFNATTQFTQATSFLTCLSNRFALRTLKKVGASWVEVDYQETVGTWASGVCSAGLAHILSPSEYSPTGDYRVRAKAIRTDGSLETVSIIGAYWQ
jgi:hypothetical protein